MPNIVYTERQGHATELARQFARMGFDAVVAVGGDGNWIEVQIRSERMNEMAERGFAAHWKYKIGEGEAAKAPRKRAQKARADKEEAPAAEEAAEETAAE